MHRRNLVITGTLLTCVVASGCSAALSDAVRPASVAIGTNARTQQVDALGFAIVVDDEGHGRVVGTLINTEHRPHAVTGAALKSEGTPVRTAVLADVIRLPSQDPVDLVHEPPVSVPAADLSVGSFVELTLDVTEGELVEMLVPVEARQGPYADVDMVVPAAADAG